MKHFYIKSFISLFQFEVPEEVEQLKIVGYFSDTDQNRDMVAETIAWAAYAPRDQHIFVHSSTKEINIGQYVVFHLKASFPLDHFDWIILAKNIILNSGREYAPDIFSNMITFSLVVSSDMAPGFHIVVYTKTSDDFLISDAAFYPVNAINRHKIQFGITQTRKLLPWHALQHADVLIFCETHHIDTSSFVDPPHVLCDGESHKNESHIPIDDQPEKSETVATVATTKRFDEHKGVPFLRKSRQNSK